MTRQHRIPFVRAHRTLLGLALGLIGVLVMAQPAAAHASLVSVDPPDGARLDESPVAVTLTFSEPVSAELGGVRVLDGDGDQVQEGAAVVDRTRVTIGLRPGLPDGTYVISYRVVSADGHPVRGGSVFGVGEGEVDTGALGRVTGGADDRTWEVVGGVGRGLAYAGVLLAAGTALFITLILPAGGLAPPAGLLRMVALAAAVGGLASLVAPPVQAALGTGQGPGSLFDDGVLADVLADGVGHGLLLCLVGLLLLTAGVTRSAPAVVVGSLVAAGSFAATGHTRAGDTALPATLSDIAHLVAAALWGGGLVALWWTLAHRRHVAADDPEHRAATARVVRRFSTVATGSIVVVGLAGLVMSWSEVRALSALTGTTYGRFLLAKVGVVAAIAALGAYNHFRLVPALDRGKARAALAGLGRTLRLEGAGLVAVLGLTAVLVVLTPAKASTDAGVVERVITVESGSVQLVVAPATAGVNQIHIYLYDKAARPADLAEGVVLELSQPAAGVGPIEREAERAGPAHFQLNGDDLSIAGDWEVTVRLRLDRFTERSETVTVPVAS